MKLKSAVLMVAMFLLSVVSVHGQHKHHDHGKNRPPHGVFDFSESGHAHTHFAFKAAMIHHSGETTALLGFGVEKEDEWDEFWALSLMASPTGSHVGLHFHAPIPNEESNVGVYFAADWHKGEGAVGQLGLGPIVKPEEADWQLGLFGVLWDVHPVDSEELSEETDDLVESVDLPASLNPIDVEEENTHQHGAEGLHFGVIGLLELKFEEESNLKLEITGGIKIAEEADSFIKAKFSVGL